MQVILQRVNGFLGLAILATLVLYFGKALLVPLFLGALFAMLMAPWCRKLDKKMNRSLSSFICTLAVAVCILVVLGIAGWQLATLIDEIPVIQKRAKGLIDTVEKFIYETFTISPKKQESIAQRQFQTFSESAASYTGKMLGGLTSSIAWLVLSLLFTFLFLYTKERYELFFVKLFKHEEPARIKSIVGKISRVSEQYLLGRTFSILILFFCYTTGLLIIGIKNALLLAAVASILTIIPYVGTIIGSLFPIIMAMVTEDSFPPVIWTAVVMTGIQTIDNYFVEPYVVGGEVNLSGMATIVSVVAGGLIWGVAGTILFIPLLAIVKILCDHVEPLKPYGYLIGDPDGNKPSKMKTWLKNTLSKLR